MTTTHTPVLIVGGGLTGLSTAAFLSWHGVPCTLVERHPDLLIHPRLRGVTPRTVELFRQLGLEPAIRAAAFTDVDDFRWVPVLAETLAGEHATPEEGPEEGPEAGDGFGDASPSPMGAIDQDKLEVLLRDRACELGADVRFSTELVSFADDGAAIKAVLADRRTGDEQTIRAEYLVGADGYASPVRSHLGIRLDGPGLMYHALSTIVDADLTPALQGRRVSIAYLQRPRPHSVLMAHDGEGHRWVFSCGYSPEHESLGDYTDQRIAEMVRAAAGLTDVEVRIRPQIPGTDLKVLAFPIGAQVAREYRSGRAFLAGDAAHIVPPTGGLGGNTCVQDAHNLAWKLATVLRGDAGAGLLDTYHAERHPVGVFTMGQALARFGTRMGPADGAPPLVDHRAVTFGYQYRSSAVLGADAETSPLLPHDLTGAPGHQGSAPGRHEGRSGDLHDRPVREELRFAGRRRRVGVDRCRRAGRQGAGHPPGQVPVRRRTDRWVIGDARNRRGRCPAGPSGRLRRLAQRPSGGRPGARPGGGPHHGAGPLTGPLTKRGR